MTLAVVAPIPETFINCWNIGDDESARMWAEYTTSPESVTISTSFGRLTKLLPTNELIISRVKYVDETTPRCEFFHTTPFFYKDKRFSFESELRLVRPVLEGEHVMVEDKMAFGKLIRVEVSGLIDRIVANKNISEAVLGHIRNLAAKYCGGAQVLRSTVEPRIRQV